MKTKIIILTITILALTSCRKYEEGGFYVLSNMSKKIAGGIIGASAFSAATANLYNAITPDDYQTHPYFTPFGNFWK